MRRIDADALLIQIGKLRTVPLTMNCHKDDVIRTILNAPTVGGWISVKDRLPEQAGYRCLVSAEYGDGKRTVFTAYTGYGKPGWWTCDLAHMERAMYADNHVHHNYHITHWMPLPEPPKEEVDNEY